MTVYAPFVNGGNCDLPWEFYHDNNLPTVNLFAALPKIGGGNDAYQSGANCGRCIRVRCSCHQPVSMQTNN
jgi:hypothetical protein